MGAEFVQVPFYHPANQKFRFVFLALLCFMTFGSYWCYDIPDAIQDTLTKKYDLTSSEYAYLYSVYNFMNIGVVLFGGYFIDMIGLRVGSILFCFLITLGQVVFSIGSLFENIHTAYYVMLAGRCIFSLGGESLSVAQSTYAAKWFRGKELALAFGITLSFSRIGSFANLNSTPKLATHYGISWAIWAGTATCLISLLLTTFAALSDKLRDKKIKADATEPEKPKIPFRVSDILHFPLPLWLIYAICVCFYVPIFTLISISGLPYLQRQFNYSQSTGNSYLSIPYIMSAALAPICGFLVDKLNRKPLFLLISNAFMVGTFAIILFLLNAVHETYILIIGMVLLGFSYSLCAASLWPCVPLLVPEERVGTAYAIMNSLQNGGLAIAGVVAGALACDNAKTLKCATRPILFLGCVSLAAVAFCVFLWVNDLAKKGRSMGGPVEAEKKPLLEGTVNS